MNILVVDDEESICDFCERSLKPLGHSVAEASSGEAALKILEEGAFDIVLTDIVMSGKTDGCKLLKEVRKKFALTDVILMTGYPTIETALAAMKEGAYDYLVKPFNMEELSSVVSRCLEKRNLKNNLEAAYQDLKKLNDSREIFMQLLVHDMKNPLSGIMGNTQILLADDRQGEELETLQDIYHSAQRLHQMVINLLDIGRMEEGRLVPNPRSVLILDLFSEIYHMMKAQFEMKRVRVSFSAEPRSLSIVVDPELMLRVLQNLLDNSLHYVCSGENIELSAVANQDGLIFIRVKDDGLGISKENLQSIFTRYGRITNPGDRTNRGLGLYFCKLAVEAHHGTIELEESARGASFLIKLHCGKKTDQC